MKRLSLPLVLMLLHAAPAEAQASNWRTVHQTQSWYAAFVDHAISDRNAIVADFQWRRMDWGDLPQQNMVRVGLLTTVAAGARVGGGYAYIASQPYGEVPAPSPTREHRVWQQLLFTHRAGAVSFAQRYRLEQRWIAPVTTDAATGDKEVGLWSYQNRARYQVRAQGNLPSVKLGSRPVMGFVYDELLMPFGHGNPTLRIAQNRLGGGIGIPLSEHQRLEVGYLNLYNALTSQQVNEINHTLTVSYVWTVNR